MLDSGMVSIVIPSKLGPKVGGELHSRFCGLGQTMEVEKTSDTSDGSGIAIVGNMNTGKTTLFAKLCGSHSQSINYPGTTVSIAKGKIRGIEKSAFDTPGTCSIFAQNEDEQVSRDILLSFDMAERIEGAILVADAKKLKRSVALAIQYAEYGVPMLFDLNMIDEAESRGIEIDNASLAAHLGIDVCQSVATEGMGVDGIRDKLSSLKSPNRLVKYPQKVEEFIELVNKLLTRDGHQPSRGFALLLLSGDKSVEEHVEKHFGFGMLEQIKGLAQQYRQEMGDSFDYLLTHLYNKKAEEIVRRVQRIRPPLKNPIIERFGEWCMQYRTGIPIAFVAIALMYLFVGVFGAGFLVTTIHDGLLKGFLSPWIVTLVQPVPSAFIRDLIVDPNFGLIPTALFLALGVVFPVLLCFYFFFGLLDDSGYLPRLSVLLENVFQKIGLNGKAVMPLAMGFSCVTMAILTTRTLESKKHKTIASFLLLLGFPCAPLLSVMLILLGKMPLTATLTVFGLLAAQVLLAGFLASKIFSGTRIPLLIEVPNMRVPIVRKVIKRSVERACFFLKEAIPVFLMASLVVFLFDRIGGLALLERLSQPVVHDFIGLPEKSVQVFIKTLITRESGAAELVRLSGFYSHSQLVVNLFIMTFLVPCLNAVMALVKERGPKVASIMVGALVLYAICVGAFLNHLFRLLGITFA